VFVARLNAGGEAVAKLSVIGGSGTDSANGIALGSGSPAAAYVVGDTSSNDFPHTTSSYQTTYGGSGDGFFFVLNSAGTTLTYSTYIGGANADHAYGVAVNGTIAHIVGGTATGGLFNTVANFAGINGTSDGYLIKLDPAQTGTAALLWATYVGGAGDDDTRAVALLNANTAYITGVTGSGSGFLTSTLTGTPYQAALAGTSDAYVSKFDTRSALTLDNSNKPTCTTTGTNRIVVTTNSNHNLVAGQWVVLSNVGDSAGGLVFNGVHQVMGGTNPPSGKVFAYIDNTQCHGNPGSTNGQTAASVGTVTPALLYNTYVGGNLTDGGLAIALDAAGNAYIAGSTTSATGLASASTIQNTIGGGTDGFVAEVATTGSSLVYSSYLGGAGTDTATAIAVNPACAVSCETWVAGSTQSSGVAAFQTSQFGGGNLSGGSDGFVVRVNGAGGALVFGSYLGGSNAGTAEQINGMALNAATNQVYVAGTTDSNDIAVTSSAAQHSSPFSPSGFVAKLSGNSDADPALTITPGAPSADPLVASQAVTYTWTVGNATSATNMTFDMPIPQDGGGNDYLNITSGTPNCVFRQGSASTGPGGVTCQLADKASASSQGVTINATLNPAIAACVLQPCASFPLTPKVTAAESEGAGNPKTSATTTGHVAESVTLSLTGTSANSNVSGGAQYKDSVDTSIVYTLQVANAAADPTDVNILVTMTYPANFVVDSSDAGCTNNTPGAGKIQCNVGIVPAGGTASKNVTGHFTTVAAPATLNSTLSATAATASTTQVYPTNANNTNFVFPVAYLGPTADLQVTTPLTITAGPVHIGSPISIQASYQNKAGSDPTTTTTLTFTFSQPFLGVGLPAGCTQAGGAGANVVCTLGGLAGGATGSITLNGNAPLSNASGNATMNVAATITATGPTVVSTGDDTGNGSIQIVRDVALSVSNFTATPNTNIHQTQTITYSVDVTNGGPDPATTISTVFTLTANYANFTPISGGCVATNSTTVTCTNAGPLASGASQTGISFSIKPDPALIPTSSPSGTITASVAVSTTAANLNTGATPSAGPINTTVERRTDINITAFTNSPNPIGQTANVTYTATVQNDGVNDGKNIRIHFTLPLNYVINAGGTSASCNVNVTTTGRDCDIATLQPGAGNAVTLNVSFAPAAGTVPTTSANATINASVNVAAAQVAVGNIDGVTGTKNRGPVATTVERRADTALTSFTGPATAPDSTNIVYNAAISNSAISDTAEGVKLDITFGPAAAAGFSFVSTTAPGGCVISTPTVLTCTVGTLAANANSAFNVVIKPPVGFLGGAAQVNLTADTHVSGNYVDGTGGNDSQPQVQTAVQASADLAVTMTANNDPTNISNGEVYILTAQNVAGSVATNLRVRITMAINSGRSFTATATSAGSFFSPHWSCGALPVVGGNTLTCTYSLPMNPGDTTETLLIGGDVILPNNQQNGNITSTAVVDTFPASVVESNASNNTSAPTVLVQRLADIGLAPIDTRPFAGATAGPLNGVYQQGVHDHLKYFISVTNFGPDQAVGVSVSAPAPVGATLYGGNPTPFTYVDSVGPGNCALSAGNFLCTNLTIDSGATATIVLDMVPGQISTQSGTLNTNWTANSAFIIDNNGSLGSNNQSSSVSIERHGDFSVAISTPAGPIVTGFTGNTITYNVTVTGDPLLNLTNVQVQDVLPTNLTFNSAVPGAGVSCGNVVNTVTCNIATLNAGATANFSIIATPSVPNTNSQIAVQNTVSGSTSSIFDDNPGNNTNITSGSTVLLGDTDLQVSITSAPVGGTAPGANAGEVIAGQDLLYTITVSNVGPHQSGTLRVDHVIPAGTTLVSVNSLSLGCSAMPCVNVGGLGAGASAQIAVVVHVPASAVTTDPTTLNYSVLATNFGATTVGANTSDPNNANNNITVGTTARQTSDMTLAAGVAPALVQQAQPGTFTITVTNSTSLNNASGVVVTIPITAAPASNSTSASASASPGGACAPSGLGTAAAKLTCNIGTLAPGAASTITMTVTPTLSGQVQITPAVTVTNVDPVSGNNSATSTLLVGNTPPGNNISVNPANSTTGVANPNIVVTFPTVSNPGGNTSADPTSFVPAPPSGYKNPVVSFDLATTAPHSGNPTTVCFNVSGSFTKPERTRVFAYVSGSPVDITFVGVGAPFTMGPAGGTVCGNINIIGAFNSTPVTFVVTEPQNSVPTALASGSQSQGTGKGLTGTGITLSAVGSVDDSNLCVQGVNASATCNDLSNALLTWNGQFTDANQKQVQCVPGAGNAAAVPPQVTYPACLQLSASVPFGSQTITLTITDAYGLTSAAATATLSLAGGAQTGNTTVTLNPGQSATFGLSYAAGASAVNLVAVLSPANSSITCTVNPASIPAGVTNNSVSLLCSTQGAVFAKNEPVFPTDNSSPMLASAIGITALPLVGMVLLPTRRRRGKGMKVLAILGLILLMTLFMSACGGGGGSSFGGSAKLQSAGTAKGTYTVTVVGKDSAGNTVGTSVGPFTIVVQ
jgi:uncharacterized repeat protein (TIGR01451 family)